MTTWDPTLARPFLVGFSEAMDLILLVSTGVMAVCFLVLLRLPEIELRSGSAFSEHVPTKMLLTPPARRQWQPLRTPQPPVPRLQMARPRMFAPASVNLWSLVALTDPEPTGQRRTIRCGHEVEHIKGIDQSLADEHIDCVPLRVAQRH